RINIDGAAFQRFEADQRAAERVPPVHVKAAILQKLGHDLGQDLSFDILFATDHDRGARRLGPNSGRPAEQDNQRDDWGGAHRLPQDSSWVRKNVRTNSVAGALTISSQGPCWTMRPRSSTARRWATFNASRRSCVTRTMVRGSDACRRRNSW